MDEEKNYSRVNKYDKRRKTTKSITILMIVAVGLVVLLIALLVFGDKDTDDKDEKTTPSKETTTEEVNGDEDESNSEDPTEGEEGTEDSNPSDEQDEDEGADDFVEIENIPDEEIDDPNVIEAYTANWKPIGTTQEEPHTSVFNEDSDDWKEMIEAVAYALKVDEDDFVSHWIGNGGEQRANAHVQSKLTDEHYTVYLEWIETEGWQPKKVERVERFIHPDQAD